MSIFLLILKIIGIVLLVLFSIVLFLVLLILFCPITYRIKGSYRDRIPDVQIRGFWLLYLLGICARVDEEGIHTFLRVLGLKKSLSKIHNIPDFEDTKKNDFPEATIPEKEPMPQQVAEESSTLTVCGVTEQKEDEKKRFSPVEHITGFVDAIRNFIRRVVHAVKNIRESLNKFLNLIQDQQNQEAFRVIRSKVFQLLKHLMPRKLKLSLQYSTGSPDTTGQLLGVLAMFPMGYRNRWRVTPDFEADEFYAEADFDVRGHLFGFQILKAALGIVLDKNCRNLYNKFMK